ncbi:hypothetical protein MKW92_045238 [Papaver armeniacum]|nr:hypothetical protein MKW92_045238 [Papaver armeniacum]
MTFFFFLKKYNLKEVYPLFRICCLRRWDCLTAQLEIQKGGVSRWRLTGIAALRDCKLKIFPNQAFEVEASARTLDLTNNKIDAIPKEIGKLINIQRLTILLNMSICNLHCLKSLCMDNNNVSQIPQNPLKDCKALLRISLHGHPISMDQWKDSKILKEKRKVRQAY